MSEHQQTQKSKKSESSSQRKTIPINQIQISNPAAIIQRARINPKSLTPTDVLQLQRTIGNRAVGRLLSEIRRPSMVQQVTIQRQELEEEETCPSCVQRQETPEEDETLQGKFETIQRLEPEDEEKLQMKSVVQRQEIPEEEELIQGKMIGTIQRQEISEEEEPLQPKRENNTGMPDNLKAGVENLSGIDMSDVRVHYNSDKPAEVGALAYTQGTNIHVAPGQERHLPHEAWHVVQQVQGRVRPTLKMKEIAVNNDIGLEQEADVMGAKSLKVSNQASTFHLINNKQESLAQSWLQRTSASVQQKSHYEPYNRGLTEYGQGPVWAVSEPLLIQRKKVMFDGKLVEPADYTLQFLLETLGTRDDLSKETQGEFQSAVMKKVLVERLISLSPKPFPQYPIRLPREVLSMIMNSRRTVAENAEAQTEDAPHKESEEDVEVEREKSWLSLSSKKYGERVRKKEESELQAEISKAEAKLKTETESKTDLKGQLKKAWNIEKQSKVQSAKAALEDLRRKEAELCSLEEQAAKEWLADLQAMRSAGLCRDAIDALVGHLGNDIVHNVIKKSSATALACLAKPLHPYQVGSLLVASNQEVPRGLTDQIVSVFPSLFKNGCSAECVVSGIRYLGPHLVTLAEQPMDACVKLLSVTNLKKLSLMVTGGQSAQLSFLVQKTSVKLVDILLDVVQTAPDLGALCRANVEYLTSLLTAKGIPQSWFCAPELASTAMLLSRNDFPECLPMLPALAKVNLGPSKLLLTLNMGAPAAVVASGVDKARDLLQSEDQVLAYFRAKPNHSLVQYSQSVAQAAATAASVLPTPDGIGTAPSGAQYTKWKHTAILNKDILAMLLREEYATIKYVSTFRTVTETFEGGDTEEYEINTYDGENWRCLWVVHIHRKRGEGLQNSPEASHIKREKERTLKEAKRIQIDSEIVNACRKLHPGRK